MGQDLLELGEIMLAASERRLEITSNNVSNASTPGFKRSVTFQDVVTTAATRAETSIVASTDFSQGPLRQTDRALDLALSGAGFFMLRSEDRTYYGRGGQFNRDSDGRVVNAQGLALQTDQGDDLLLTHGPVEFLQDGTVLENGLPIGRLGLFETDEGAAIEATSGSLFSADVMRPATQPLVRQGALETANVAMADEIIQMMASLRQAEAGARIVQTYDSLIGQSISTFGGASR